jgi:hypothetical protein
MATGAQVMVNGKPVMTAELKPDTSGSPDLLQFGDFTMFVIKRGSRYGIRMRDLRSTMRQEFSGLQWFPIRPGHRIVAKFVSYPKMQTLPVPNVLGEIEQQPTPGYAEFKLGGRTHRLHPVLEGTSYSSSSRIRLRAVQLTAPDDSSIQICRKMARWFSTSTKPITRPARTRPTQPARCRRSRIAST